MRKDPEVNEQIVRFLGQHAAKSVIMPDQILGCPQEGGKDNPESERGRSVHVCKCEEGAFYHLQVAQRWLTYFRLGLTRMARWR